MDERIKYETMYRIAEYRVVSPGASMANEFLRKYVGKEKKTINIYGCGPGRCGKIMHGAGHTVRMIDIAENCLDKHVADSLSQPDFEFYVENLAFMNRIPASEFGYCVDVMEHLPTKWVGDALRKIKLKTYSLVFFIISGMPDSCGQLIGEKLHLTIKPAEWWAGALNCHWPNVHREDNSHHTFRFICEG